METKPIIPNDLNIIPLGNVSIAKDAYQGLIAYCQTHKLKTSDMFLYVDDGDIMAGFSADKLKHVKLDPTHWKPVHEC